MFVGNLICFTDYIPVLTGFFGGVLSYIAIRALIK